MVKECSGSILLPEKHSLLYLSMLLRQGLFTWNRNRRRGGGVDPSESPACPRLAGWLGFHTGRSRPGGERPAQQPAAWFSSTSWIKRVISAPSQEPPRCQRPLGLPSPSTGVRGQQFPPPPRDYTRPPDARRSLEPRKASSHTVTTAHGGKIKTLTELTEFPSLTAPKQHGPL